MKHPVPEPDQIKYYKHHVLLERFKDYIKEICIHDKVNNNALLKLCNVCIIFSLDVVWISSIFKNLNIIGVIFRKQVFKRYVKFLTMIFWYIVMILASCCNTRISNYNICFLISALYVLYLIAINEVVAATHHIISHLFKTFLRYSIWSAKRKSL